MNIRRIKALRNFIAKLPPEAVYMPDYIECDRPKETVAQAAKHTCGTKACIAGWAVLRFHKGRKDWIVGGDTIKSGEYRRTVPSIAKELLDLDDDAAAALFLGDWSTCDKSRYDMTQEDVLDELDHLIETGQV